MNNEETMMDQEIQEGTKKSGAGAKVAIGVAGAAFGAGATMAGQAFAGTKDEAAVDEAAKEESANEEDSKSENTPAPDESIVATATGVRVAQVDDSMSFNEAFASARAQVGAGGVFAWHGKAYGTYYKDEWDNMSVDEKAAYHNSIDYSEVLPAGSVAQHTHHAHHTTTHTVIDVEETASNGEANAVAHEQNTQMATADEQDVEVHVLRVGTADVDGDGYADNVALVDIDGTPVMLVDVDQNQVADIAVWDANGDGTPIALVDIDHNQVADIAICDVNRDGNIGEGEVADVSNENVIMPPIADVNACASQTETQPDYMDPCNSGLFEI